MIFHVSSAYRYRPVYTYFFKSHNVLNAEESKNKKPRQWEENRFPNTKYFRQNELNISDWLLNTCFLKDGGQTISELNIYSISPCGKEH